MIFSKKFFNTQNLAETHHKYLQEYFNKHSRKNLLMPFGYGGLFLNEIDFECGYYNNSYGPWAVIIYAVREYPDKFYRLVSNHSINSAKDFDDLRRDFNKSWSRILSKLDKNSARLHDVDLMLYLASSFFVLIQSSDIISGFQLSSENTFENRWSGRKYTCRKTLYEIRNWSKMLKKKQVYFSDMSYQSFFWSKAKEYGNKDSFWFYNLDAPVKKNSYAEKFTFQDLTRVMDEHVSILKYRDAQFMIILPEREEVLEHLHKGFSFYNTSENKWKNSFCQMSSNVGKGVKFIIIENK